MINTENITPARYFPSRTILILVTHVPELRVTLYNETDRNQTKPNETLGILTHITNKRHEN